MKNSLRLAYFSPLPPARTGIADYSRELLPDLARLSEVTLFAGHPAEVDESLRQQMSVRPMEAYPSERWGFDATIYQMGNSLHHESVYRMLCEYPGIAVLHEHGLHHFVAERTVGRGDNSGYVREMGYALGVAGARWAREVVKGIRPYPLFEVPLSDRVLAASLGLVVHSQYLRSLIHQRYPDLALSVIPAPVGMNSGSSRRSELGWPSDAIIFASAGQITAAKQVDQSLRAFARLRESVPQATYLVIGEWRQATLNLAELVAELGLESAVKHTGFVDDLHDFVDWIATADVVLNLRYPTVGETSATALRALAGGRPLIVCDVGGYSELPDEVCLKVPPQEESALLAAMRRLAGDGDLRQKMGQAAAAYARRVHHPARAAEQYMTFIRQVLSNLVGSLMG